MSEKVRTHKPRQRTPEDALKRLMDLCARSERASGDAMRLMQRWGVELTERQGVLEKLIEMKFIDDRRYADLYVREKIRLSGWGEYKIAKALSNKKVSREIITEALEQLDQDTVQIRLEEMIRRKSPRTKATSGYDLKGKLVRYGAGLGYEYEDVITIVEKIIDEDERFTQ